MTEPMLWVVAGCLFEVSLPARRAARWRWASPTPEVTLLSDHVREGRHHFRFRAEAAGSRAGVVDLRFRPDDAGTADAAVAVRIAPERLPDP